MRPARPSRRIGRAAGEEYAIIMMRSRHERDTRRETLSATAGRQSKHSAGHLRKVGSYLNAKGLTPAARDFLDRLLEQQLLNSDSVVQFLERMRDGLSQYAEVESLGQALVEAGLLTAYQLDRILAGTTHGLILGNHRVLDRLGAGAMGVVFLAEHMLLKRQVAIKVLPMDDECPPALWERFCSEMRVLATLHHPNVVMAFDAGQVPVAGSRMPTLLYLAMELVSGGDLEQYVQDHGPVAIPQACEWIRQAACGLQEAHDHHLIHRDVKPSNLLLSAQNQVKVTDFGLVRQFSSRLTSHHNLLGTLDYMAPEQSCDPSLVDGRADIYGLGATLFWLLTGELPYPPAHSLREALRSIQSGKPRHVKSLRAEVPAELDALIDRMLQLDPAQRPALPLNIMNELLPFTTNGRSRPTIAEATEPDAQPAEPVADAEPATASSAGLKRVLVVDDEAPVRLLARATLETSDLMCSEAADGATALAILQKQDYDLILLDRSEER